jgi:3-oxosteroid 1-dehydrogenase
MAVSETYDLVCVGSGAAGSAAALAGAELGLSVCLLEKASQLGGGSAYSTGGLWAGNNHLARAAGIADSREETLAYMAFVAGGVALPANLAAYIDQAPAAIQAFEAMGVRFHLRPAVPDHFYPSAPGSKAGGRTMGCAPIHRSALGLWRDRLMESPYFMPGISNLDIFDWGGLGNMRHWDPELIEARRRSGVLGTGQAVVGQFLAGVIRRHGAIVCDSPVEELVVEDGRVVGVLVLRDGKRVRIGARRGVVLATGGYEGSSELVARFEAVPVPEWRSMFPPDVAGDGLVMATEIGAALYRIPENYFLFLGYDIPQADGTSTYRMTGFTELTFPHTIVVNRAGQRFFDESSFQKGVLAIKAFDTATHTYTNLPCWMIFDHQFAERYTFAGRPPGAGIPEWVVRSPTLNGLSGALGIDAAGLTQMVARFNPPAAAGTDPEFGRGSFLWIKAISGDADHPTHPNLGPIERPPFYGVRLHPSGSSSVGLLTDAQARVRHVRGHPIEGLYACGTAAAAADVGVGYQAGYLLTRGLTFGWLAARHAAGV